MRCFLAIEIPEEIKSELLSLGKSFDLIGKYVERKNIHITLKFLGEIKDKDIKELRSSLRAVKFTRFRARLGKIGVFPSEIMPRVLWVGIEPKEELKKLYLEIEKSLGNKEEKFESHATLARIKSIKDRAKFLDKIKNKINPLEFEVKEFILKKSTLTPIGPIYEDIERFKLTD